MAWETGQLVPGEQKAGQAGLQPPREERGGRAGGGAQRSAASPLSRSLGGEGGKLPGLGSGQLRPPALRSRLPVPGASPPLPRLPSVRHGQSLRPPLQVAADRGLGGGQDLSDHSLCRRQLQQHLHLHYRNRLQDPHCGYRGEEDQIAGLGCHVEMTLKQPPLCCRS
ncbi:ras-related protein Rab-13 isoform X2 [Acinonyx jubatus]|uniref:Ras-related protein Rab-13 isoform X2 n=1 Tax=Acinonyx jubatus TaxID=32536 RepID=A0ABM3P0Z8_ACIJB|nr:ras-related protein Rab-13 isoform X2 [Acinonyx jubatus]